MPTSDANFSNLTPPGRRRSLSTLRLLLGFLALVVAGCGGSAATTTSENPADAEAATATATADAAESIDADAAVAEPDGPAATPQPTPTPHPLAVAPTELPKAPIGFESLVESVEDRPVPVSIDIESIDVQSATVIPVGVNPDDLSFEVPPADQVGWYEFGSAPGEAGSAVLAAHIAYNGVDGVFRYLDDVESGSIVAVGFDDGSARRFRVTEIIEYVKEDLPDSLFARDGDEQLALITCGGNFNYQLSSYESNIVVIAIPI